MSKQRLAITFLVSLFSLTSASSQLPEETVSHLIPLAVSTGGWETGITVVNVTESPLTIQNLVVYSVSGEPRELACDACVIPPRGRFSKLLSELAGQDVNGTLQLTIKGAGARKAICQQVLYWTDQKHFTVLPAQNLSSFGAMDLETSRQVAIAAIHTAAIGLSAVLPGLPDTDARISHIRAFIDLIRFNPDRLGYFYVYDYNCVNIAHAIQKDIQGTSLYDHQDTRGKFVIRELALAARNGGGFVDFYWVKPGTTGEHPKLGYVEPIPGTDYFIGSGVYLPE